MKKIIIVLFTSSLAMLSNIVWAKTYYVSDVLHVPMRSGAGNEFRIIHRGIKSGVALTILEEPDGDWVKVTTPSGLEGWMRKQYLIDEPTAQIKLNSATAELARAKKELGELASKFSTLQQEHAQLQEYANKQARERNTFEAELKELKVLSADAIKLNKTYHELVATKEILETERDSLQAENERLKKDKTINQWLFGAGLLILGMILMLILPALKPAKRQSDWVN